MVSNKENITKEITMLEELLTKCTEEETTIGIHGTIDGVTFRNTLVLEEFSVDQDEIYLIFGWFEIKIDSIVNNISFLEDENSVHISFSNGELYMDLN